MKSRLLSAVAVAILLSVATAAHAHHISGKVVCDEDNDGNFDASDSAVSGIDVKITSIDAMPGQTFNDTTDAQGAYNVGLPARTDRYKVELINLPAGFVVVIPASGFFTIQIITGNSTTDHKDNVDFLLQGCSKNPTTTTTTTTTTSSTTTTIKVTTTTTSTTTSTSSTLPVCDCAGTPFLLNRDGKFNNDGELFASVGVNSPGGRVRLGKSVIMADGTTITGSTVSIGVGSSVFKVLTNDLQGMDFTVRDSVAAPVLPIVDPFCVIPSFTCGSQAVNVPLGGHLDLTPGSYGALRVANAASLTLAPGTYEFCSVKIGKEATVEALGSVVLNVTGNFVVGVSSSVSPVAGQPIMLINVAGRKVRISSDAFANAAIRAPNAKSQLGRNSDVLGCLCAETGRSDKHITLECQP